MDFRIRARKTYKPVILYIRILECVWWFKVETKIEKDVNSAFNRCFKTVSDLFQPTIISFEYHNIDK